jgi:hypothetical protein
MFEKDLNHDSYFLRSHIQAMQIKVHVSNLSLVHANFEDPKKMAENLQITHQDLYRGHDKLFYKSILN